MKPMLATAAELSELRYPLYASPKLDGVRGVIVDGKLRSRSLKAFPNPHVSALFSKQGLDGLDGELILGDPTAKDVYRVTNGACARETGTPDVELWVFDDFNAKGGFEARLERLGRRTFDYPVMLLGQHVVMNEQELLDYEKEQLDLGYEGLILRSPEGPYKFGRSTVKEGWMLKLKRFLDSEAEILDVEEEMENTNEKVTNELGRGQRSSHQAGLVPKGRAGTLCVRDVSSKVEFRIGTGLDDADKVYYWRERHRVIGKLVKYKYFPVGVKDKPRHPVYLGGREKWDL